MEEAKARSWRDEAIGRRDGDGWGYGSVGERCGEEEREQGRKRNYSASSSQRYGSRRVAKPLLRCEKEARRRGE